MEPSLMHPLKPLWAPKVLLPWTGSCRTNLLPHLVHLALSCWGCFLDTGSNSSVYESSWTVSHNVSPEAWPQTHSSLYPAEGKGVGTATCKLCGGSLKGSEGLMAPQRQLSPEGVMHLTSRAALLLPEGKFVLENA